MTTTPASVTDRSPAPVAKQTGRARRLFDHAVEFRWIAAAGALTTAVAPALMATQQGGVLEGSISAYWDVEPESYFLVPFTVAAILLFVDGCLSYVGPNRNRFGRRWYNLVLGVSLALLTWFNKDDDPSVHYPAATVFFALFIVVIAYTTALAWFGQRTDVPVLSGETTEREPKAEVVGAQVAAVFLGLLAVTLVAWGLGLISFFFFEVFALVNFAVFYVQGLVNPLPFGVYEFRWPAANQLFRSLRIMRPRPKLDVRTGRV